MSTIDDKNSLNHAQGLGAAHQANSSSASHEASPDDMMYKAMLALVTELQTLSDAQVSDAKLATALYKDMIPNSTSALQKMQHDLDDYTWLQEHFDEFNNYFNAPLPKPPMPPLGPGMSAGDMKTIEDFWKQHPSLTSCRMAVTTLGQQISAQNTYVQDAKAIPTGLENDSKNLADSQGQVSSEIPSFLLLMKEQYMAPW